MAAETLLTPEGWTKSKYASDPTVAIPEHILLQQLIPFNKAEAGLGKDFKFPILLRHGYGATFNGGMTAGDVFTINTPTATDMQEATVVGTEFADRMQMSYGIISSAQKKGEEAFGNFMTEWTMYLANRDRTILEANFLYGGDDIGIVESNDYSSGTSCNITITAASFTAGLMAGAEGYNVDFWDDDWNPQRNTNAPVVIGNINPDTRVIAVTGNATDLAAIVAGDRMVPLGARKSASANNWFSGVHAHLTNTGSLHGIDAATYQLYKSSTVDNLSNPLSM
jgi:hypothetical protein